MAFKDLVEAIDSDKTGRDRLIAVYIGVLAVVLAVCGVGGGNAMKDATARNIEASNIWAFFQAKNIRRHELRLQIAEFEVLLAGQPNMPPAARAPDRRKAEEVSRRRGPADDGAGDRRGRRTSCKVRAKSLELQRDRAMRQGPVLRLRAGAAADRHRAGVGGHHHRRDHTFGAERGAGRPRHAVDPQRLLPVRIGRGSSEPSSPCRGRPQRLALRRFRPTPCPGPHRMTTYNLLLLPGDGIGVETIAEVERIVDFFNKAEHRRNSPPSSDLVGGAAYRQARRADQRRRHGQGAEGRRGHLRRRRRSEVGRRALRHAPRGRAAAPAQGPRPVRQPAPGDLLSGAGRRLLAEARAGRGPRHHDRARADGRGVLRRAEGDRHPGERREARRRYAGLHDAPRSSASPRSPSTSPASAATRCTRPRSATSCAPACCGTRSSRRRTRRTRPT